MSAESRSFILQGLRAALDDGPGDGRSAAEVERRIAAHAPNLVPSRAQLPPREMQALFVAKAEQAAATVDRVGVAGLAHALQRYLSTHNLPPAVVMSPDPALDAYPWARMGLLDIRRGRATADDAVSVTPALAGIAETATLMFWSAPSRPTSLNFLPENHVAVLRATDIVPALEDGWARLRAALPPGRPFPRTVNFVTGPSRTADIEQNLILGAHGPRRLHILLVEDGA